MTPTGTDLELTLTRSLSIVLTELSQGKQVKNISSKILLFLDCRNYQRDGPMTVTNNQGGAPNYFPNSFNGPTSNSQYKEHVSHVSGDVARWNSANEDNFTQVGIFYNKVLCPKSRLRLCDNIASHLCNAQKFIQVLRGIRLRFN